MCGGQGLSPDGPTTPTLHPITTVLSSSQSPPPTPGAGQEPDQPHWPSHSFTILTGLEMSL